METDLHAVIRANNILEEIHKQYVIYQIIKCLKYMHSAELLHRDLKPSNVLLNSECLAKVCDLGLARSIAVKEEGTAPVLTEYVATRWYRAPEILLGSQKYTKGVDMWSLGCILGELLLGKPIFPGTSTLNQLDRILELTGRPSPEDIEAIQSSLAGTMLEALPQTKTKPLHEFFPTASDEALDLLKNLLRFNPNKRFTAEEALEHPYVAEFHNIDDEPSCERVIEIAIDDNTKFSIREYRDKLYQEIMKKKKEQRKIILDNTFVPSGHSIGGGKPIVHKEEEKAQKFNSYSQQAKYEEKVEKNNNVVNTKKSMTQEKNMGYMNHNTNNNMNTNMNNNINNNIYNNHNVNNNMNNNINHNMNNNNNNNMNYNTNNNINSNQIYKQASVKGKSNLMSNGNTGNTQTAGPKNINEKNYNFIGGSQQNNKMMGPGPVQNAPKGGIMEKEKIGHTNPVPKNVLNPGIVYRNNNASVNNKKTYGKI